MATPVPLPSFEDHYATRRLFSYGSAFGRDHYLERRLAKVDDHTILYRRVYALHSKLSIDSALSAFFEQVEVDDENTTAAAFAYDCNAIVPDAAPLFVCDPSSVMKEVEDATITWSCTKREGFRTESFTYCPWVNIDVPEVPALAAYSCYTNSMLSGYEDDGADSNALCANRETCEALCLDLEDCIGIDMVIGKDRCFLNRNHPTLCSEDEVYEGDGTLQPPTGWYHPTGFGLLPGMRYADGHAAATYWLVPPDGVRPTAGHALRG